MKEISKTRCIGLLTSGGDCPGLNAAIRAVVKGVINEYGIRVIGFLDGFRGLVENRTMSLDSHTVSGILTHGGTLLGTSRTKIHKMVMGGKELDMTSVAVENIHRHQIDCLVCLGGGGTQKNALRLHRNGGIHVLTLPKTIDNDVPHTDITFGFDTAMNIAAEAIDRLHTTATSHHRMIICEIMGHNAGWLTLGAGIAGGADVILIPEIPYDLTTVAEYLLERRRSGKRFSIIAVAEGARSVAEAKAMQTAEKEEKEKKKDKKKDKKNKKNKEEKEDKEDKCEKKKDKEDKKKDKSGIEVFENTEDVEHLVTKVVNDEMLSYHTVQEAMSSRLARQLQELTGTEARVTSLGHVQRGGTPTPTDRLLCTRLGTAAADFLAKGIYNVMVAVHGENCEPVSLEEVAGLCKTVPLDHAWIRTARLVGTCMGDK